MEPLEQAVFSRTVRSRTEERPDHLALIFENGELPDEPVRFRDIARYGNQLAQAYRAAGLAKGDPVAVMLRNHPEFIYGLQANSQLGSPTVPIDPRSRGDKLRYFLEFAECSSLLTADYVVADPAAAEVIRQTGVKTWVVSTAEGRAQGIDVARDWRIANEEFEASEREDVGEHVEDVSEPWLLAYTSGTTGDPKAIRFGYDRMMLYQLTPDFFGYEEGDIPYTGLSLTHGNALVVTLMPALWARVNRSVFSRWFTRSRLWDVCIKYGCTSWSNLGGIATAVYSQPPSPKDRSHKVRVVHSAGMPRELWEPFERRYRVDILEWYGTMEGGFAYNPPGEGPVGSFGKPPEFVEMEVVDDNDEPVPARQLGELVVRPKGGKAALEYYKMPEASQKKVRGGWLHTGDKCWQDEDGWFYFSHRAEEGGIRKLGEFVSEGFIRRVIAEDPDVIDVHVYGVPSRSGAAGESDIVAAVVPIDKENFNVRRLFDRCRQRLEKSHTPDFIQAVDELPKTSSEKVQQRFLVERLDTSNPYLFARDEMTS